MLSQYSSMLDFWNIRTARLLHCNQHNIPEALLISIPAFPHNGTLLHSIGIKSSTYFSKWKE